LPGSEQRGPSLLLIFDVKKNGYMNAIRINVNKQMDGYSFSITPSIRILIKQLFPDAHPANNIFVSYDTRSNFESFVGRLENYICPALLGVEKRSDLSKLDEIQFVDPITGEVLHKVMPNDEEV